MTMKLTVVITLLMLVGCGWCELVGHRWDGEEELVGRVDGLWLRQWRLDGAGWPHTRLPTTMQQLSDGHSLMLELFYTRNQQLVDCNIVTHAQRIHAFVTSVRTTNTTTGTTNPVHSMPALDMQGLRRQCEELHEHRGGRVRRSVLIHPGTNYCGSGSKAQFAGDIGDQSEADKCCRDHDGCPYIIEGLSQRFGYFNYRFYTMSYCECDRKFFECLRAANTDTSHMLGKIFFNVVNRNCFELRRDRICANYSFWGSCNKWRNGLQADVKESPRF